MKNDQCTITLTTKNGTKQIYRKKDNTWTQKSSTGTIRPMTAEQLLSHLLPCIAFGHVKISVKPNAAAARKSKKWLKV